MTDHVPDTRQSGVATGPLALRLSEGLGVLVGKRGKDGKETL